VSHNYLLTLHLLYIKWVDPGHNVMLLQRNLFEYPVNFYRPIIWESRGKNKCSALLRIFLESRCMYVGRSPRQK